MCGIYAKISFDRTINKNTFEKKLNKISHRGPDNTGIFTYKNVALGHTRLSLLDLSVRANQPFCDDKFSLIFNGEIYNFKDLRKMYLSHLELKTSSDTEVLFELLKLKKEKVLRELDGMFAFVFFDKKTNEIFFARDKVGIKPLYYKKSNNFEIASEIKVFDYEVNMDKISDFIMQGSFQYDNLPYKDIETLSAGYYGIFDLNSRKLQIKPYVNLLDTLDQNIFLINKTRNFNELVDELDNMLYESVQMHLQSDANKASLCSDGVDSSLVSYFANENENVPLYHSGIDGFGEERYAQMVAKSINKPIVYANMTNEEYWKHFAYITYISDMPIYHPNDISLHIVAKKAHENGVKMLLSGEGADELFGGYSWHQRLMKQYRINKIFQKKPSLYKKLFGQYDKTLQDGFRFSMSEIENFMPLGLGYSDLSSSCMVKPSIFAAYNFSLWKKYQEIREAFEKINTSDLEKYVLSLIHLNVYGHLGSILHRTDRILMANSIEGRVPFLQNDIIDFSMNLSLAHKISKRFRKDGKFILKKVAQKYLPYEVVYRHKAGFPVQINMYCKNIEEIFHNGFICSFSGLNFKDIKKFYESDMSMKFRMISLEVWGRIFVWGEKYENIRIS